jgi:hypothetical protein
MVDFRETKIMIEGYSLENPRAIEIMTCQEEWFATKVFSKMLENKEIKVINVRIWRLPKNDRRGYSQTRSKSGVNPHGASLEEIRQGTG